MGENLSLCVIIPVHKPNLTPDEVISLRACKHHLAVFNCFLVYPAGMDTSAYLKINAGLQLKPVPPAWLSTVQRYNKMKLDTSFYDLFAAYKYMLTYELDAYVFNDQIGSTNALDFDFIGAPFFDGYWAAKPGAPFIKGCNSGFSVRNIQSCITVLASMKKYRFHWFLYKLFLARITLFRVKLNELTNKRFDVFVTGKFGFHFSDAHVNEDVVWGEIVPELFPFFKVADPLSALNFSFEYNLDESLRLNNNKLPFGCHAWYKHFEFWKKYIDTENEL